MELHTLKPKRGAVKNRKRLGRGNASGHGTFSGRGCKGQGQRKSGNVRPGFEGGQTPLIMRLPKWRGFKNPNRKIYQVVNVGALNDLPEGADITPETLLERKLINKKHVPVKVLGEGVLKKALTFKIHAVTASAREKILKAGGKILH